MVPLNYINNFWRTLEMENGNCAVVATAVAN